MEEKSICKCSNGSGAPSGGVGAGEVVSHTHVFIIHILFQMNTKNTIHVHTLPLE